MLQDIRRMKREEGFTLIELLIVIIILGILAAIVVFAIGQTRGDAVSSSCKTSVSQIALAADAVKTHEGSYGSAADLATAAKGGLLKSAPPIVTDNFTVTYAVTGGGPAHPTPTSQAAGKPALATPGNVDQNGTDAQIKVICAGS